MIRKLFRSAYMSGGADPPMLSWVRESNYWFITCISKQTKGIAICFNCLHFFICVFILFLFSLQNARIKTCSLNQTRSFGACQLNRQCHHALGITITNNYFSNIVDTHTHKYTTNYYRPSKAKSQHERVWMNNKQTKHNRKKMP